MTTATVMLLVAVLRQDYGVAYVAQQSRADSSTAYRVASLWSGAEGSLLLFAAMLAVAGAIAVRGRALTRPGWLMVGFAVGLLAVTTALVANPFARPAIPAIRGAGLTPILEHPAMIYHPPILYAGLVATFLPFLSVVGGNEDLRRARRWILGSFVLLTVGLATGANWAYVELGWGGYWAWDPVENTVLLPWLVLTASLHAWRLVVPPWVQRALMAMPFVLVAFGAAITRSGGLSSVHVFADAQSIGVALGLLVTVLAASLIWHLVRWSRLPTEDVPGGKLAVGGTALSQAPVLVFSVLAVLFLAVVVLLGVAFPLVPGNDRVLDSSYYTSIGAPLLVVGLGGLAFAASTSASASATARPGATDIARACIGVGAGLGVALWLGAAGWFALAASAAVGAAVVMHVRPAQFAASKLPMTVAHIGMVVLSVGIVGSAQADSIRVALDPGDIAEVGGYRMTYQSFVVSDGPRMNSEQSVATVVLRSGEQAQGEIALQPALVSYPDRAVVLAETALHSTPFRDVQVVLRTIAQDGSASFDFAVRPGVMLVWWGATLIALAGLVGLARARQPRRAKATIPRVQSGVGSSR